MSNMVTRCPQCATSFRVTSAQLQSAKGAVRCGSCLHIFKADDYLSLLTKKNNPGNPSSQPPPEQSASPAAPQGAPRIAKRDPTQSPLRQPLETTQLGAILPAGDTETSPDTISEFSDTTANVGADEDETSNLIPATSALSPEEQEQEQDFLISDDMEDIVANDTDLSHPYEFKGFIDDEIDIQAKSHVASLFERNSQETPDTEGNNLQDDESWAEALLSADEELDTETPDNGNAPPPVTEEALPITPAASSTDNLSLSAVPPKFHFVEEPAECRSDISPVVPDAPRAHNPLAPPPRMTSENLSAFAETSREALLMNIHPEPVMMSAKNSRRRRQVWLPLLLIVLLIAQVAWLQFDSLSRKEPYRTFYQTLCPWLGCHVPVLIDKNKISVRNLVVRKHPATAGALIVDVVLINAANFEQPFPELDVLFTNINDEPLAKRRFIPSEYLQGELAGLTLMPRNQPVRITLELLDPGEDAVNYKIEPR